MLRSEDVTNKAVNPRHSGVAVRDCPKCGRAGCRSSDHALFGEGRTAFICESCGFLKQGPGDPAPLPWNPRSDG